MIDALAQRYQSGDTTGTWTELRRLRDAQPDDAGLLFLEARLLDHEGHAERALPLYRRAVELDPSDPVAWTNLAYVQGSIDRDEGIATYRQLLARFPEDATAWANLGTLLESSDVAGAIAAYRTAVALEPALDGVAERLGALEGEHSRPLTAPTRRTPRPPSD